MTYCMPLALLALHRFCRDGASAIRRPRSALLAAAQLYCSMYYAVFFTIYAAALFAVLCLARRGRRCGG